MTEQEWLACTDPRGMLGFLQGEGRETARRFRLFAAACSRRIWHLMTDERSRMAVEVAEQFADGLVNRTKRKAAEMAARSARSGVLAGPTSIPAINAAFAALCTVQKALGFYEASDTANAVCYALGIAAHSSQLGKQPAHAALVRELFGNPFRSLTLDPAWQTPQVMALAKAAYDERELPAGTLDVARLAVLADALEEAGCDQAELLAHLRGPGPHVRGCWAVDLALGKE
jgi:hypothetical protein